MIFPQLDDKRVFTNHVAFSLILFRVGNIRTNTLQIWPNIPAYILPAKEIILLGKFQPDSFKTDRLACVETDGQTDRETWLDRLA